VLRIERLDALNAIVKAGLIPVFYHPDAEVAKKIATAYDAGSACSILGDFASHLADNRAQLADG
jgi:2-dehydro-3-deoxyphosphogluconate aldolase / (4S)-4-hydroxy-2-oxoglutarate aldolase